MRIYRSRQAVAFFVGILAIGFISRGCARQPKLVADILTNPAAPGSICPNLTTTSDQGVLLSWLEPSFEALALRFAVRDGQSWSSPKTVIVRKNFEKYVEAPPWVLILPNRSLIAVWGEQLPLGKNAKWPGNYLLAAASLDNGQHWSVPTIIHTDRTDGEHSFASVAVEDDNHATIVWLDSRDNEQKHTYRLMSARIDGAGTVSRENTVDDDVCTCCPTALMRTNFGLLAAYRDRTSKEVRDIYAVRQQSGTWQTGQAINNDGWHISACPVNGPALSQYRDSVIAAWFSGIEGYASLKVAFSPNSGTDFGKALALDTETANERPIGKAAVSLLDANHALVAWIRRSGSKSQLVVEQLSSNEGRRQRYVVVEGSTDDIGYPRMQRTGDAVLLSWGGAADVKKISTALITLR